MIIRMDSYVKYIELLFLFSPLSIYNSIMCNAHGRKFYWINSPNGRFSIFTQIKAEHENKRKKICLMHVIWFCVDLILPHFTACTFDIIDLS